MEKLINVIIRLWNFLEGKKTKIGALILFLLQLNIINQQLSDNWIDSLTKIGMALAGVGLADASRRALKKKLRKEGNL